MRVEHFDLALRHHPQHLLLHLRHGRRRHQREGQRKHCGSEPTPRPDRHGTLLYVVASIVVGYYSIGEGTPAPVSRLEVSDGTAQLRAEVWAIERVKTMGASPNRLLRPGNDSSILGLRARSA